MEFSDGGAKLSLNAQTGHQLSVQCFAGQKKSLRRCLPHVHLTTTTAPALPAKTHLHGWSATSLALLLHHVTILLFGTI